MKNKKSQAKNFIKPNISLRRKIRIYLDRFLLGLKIALLIFLYLFFFTNYLNSFKEWAASHIYETTSDGGMILENVLIDGHHNLSTSDVAATLNADVGTPILSIDLDKVRDILTKNEWIKNAVIERRLPNTIYVNITERDPIAIWQNDKKLYLVDDSGSVITPTDISKFANLIHIVGSDAPLHIASLKVDLDSDEALKKRIISVVRYGERRWNILLEQDITVKMPENGFTKAYKYLSKLNENNKLFSNNYKVIDLRDEAKYFLEKHSEEKKLK